MQVLNQDIVGIISKVDRFSKEMHNCVSNGVSEISAHDITRFASYLNALTDYIAWVDGQDQLDLPESHPTEFDLPESVMYSQVENESINDMLRMIYTMREELVKSQSAKRAAGLISFDRDRLLAVKRKINDLLQNYVASATPLDMPESSPRTV